MNTENILDDIKRNIKALQEENADLRKARDAYQRDKDKHEGLIADLKTQIGDLQTKRKSKAVAGQLGEDQDRLDKELGKYISIIDKCISTIQSRL